MLVVVGVAWDVAVAELGPRVTLLLIIRCGSGSDGRCATAVCLIAVARDRYELRNAGLGRFCVATDVA